MTKLDVAPFDSLTATSATSVSMSWPELAGLLSDHRERAARDGDGWSPARYAPGSTRSNGNVDALSALVLDIDHVEPEWWRLAGLRFQAHTSWKHHASHPDCPDRPDCPHWRIVIPLTKPVPRERWGEFWTQATAVLCPNVDPASKDPARFFWLPAHPPGTPCETRSGDGVPLDPARILPPEVAQPDLDRPGDRFNRETDWASILQPHGWVQVPFSGDGERWRRPGKDDGVSATADGGGHRLLYVFTSNAPPLQPQTSYTRLGAFAELEHGGDYGAAAREIAGRERRKANRRFGGSNDDYSPLKETDEESSRPRRFGGSNDDYSPLKETDEESSRPQSRFRLRRWDPGDLRAPSWVWPDLIPIGALSTLVGDGQAGKGTLAAWLIARLTKGELPGAHLGAPINVLVIGDEDSVEDQWVPRVMAAGGEVTRVLSLQSELDHDFELARDVMELVEFVREHSVGFIYLDQPLDNLSSDTNSNQPQDVRRSLKPVRRLSRKEGWGH